MSLWVNSLIFALWPDVGYSPVNDSHSALPRAR